jgi:hypothetical protein
MRKSISFFFLLFSLASAAQNTSDTTNSKLSFLSSIGIGVVDKDFNPTITNSTQTATGLEYRFSPRLSLTGVLGFDNYGYKKLGATYNFSGKLRATSFDFGLRFKLATGKLQPYIKAGGGAVRYSIPIISTGLAMTTIENRVDVVGMYSGEAGLQFRVFGRYSLFAAGEREWVSKSELLNNTFRVTTFKLGMISSF